MRSWLTLFLAVLSTSVGTVLAELVCATRGFATNADCSTYICCGRGYHVCSNREEACCPDVSVEPVSLSLVILGPLSLICSLGLLAVVIKLALNNRSDHEHSKYPASKQTHVGF